MLGALYSGIDKTAINLFSDVRKYRQFGEIFIDYYNKKLDEISANLDSSERELIEKARSDPSTMANLEVPGQLTLINLDIAGIDVNKNMERALETSFEIGYDFFLIKKLDRFMDTRHLSRDKMERLLDEFYNVKTGKQYDVDFLKSLGDNEIVTLASIDEKTNQSSIGSEYLHQMRITETENYFAENNNKKLEARLELGNAGAEYIHTFMKQGFPELPDWVKDFLIAEGTTETIWDDIWDFKLDRKRGHGYTLDYLPKMTFNFTDRLIKTVRALPTVEERKKFFGYLILADLYHLKQIFGEMERI